MKNYYVEITDLILEISSLLIKINFYIGLNLKVCNKISTSFISIWNRIPLQTVSMEFSHF